MRTRPRLLALILAFACGSARAEGVPAPDPLAPIRAAPIRGIARVIAVLEECSGLGGTHVFFEILSAEPAQAGGVAHLGGHGEGLGLWGGAPIQAPVVPGALFVVGLAPLEPAWPARPGWCLDEAPAPTLDVRGLAPVSSRESGAALLERH